MKVAELRIGNYVWDDYSGEMIVSEINISWLLLRKTRDLPEGRYKVFDIKPIPLTEEWLAKLGFKGDSLMGLHVKYSLSHFDIWHSVNENVFLVDNIKYIKVILTDVHQLQNLYYALTGDELNIK